MDFSTQVEMATNTRTQQGDSIRFSPNSVSSTHRVQQQRSRVGLWSNGKPNLQSANETAVRRAAYSIGQFGSLADDAFIGMLSHSDAAVRYIAASHIGDLRSPQRASKQLRRLLNGNSRGVRAASAYALARLGEVETALPILEQLLLVSERGIACSAAEFLGRIGPPAKPLLPFLQEQRDIQNKGGDYHVRGNLDNAMRKIRNDRTVTKGKRSPGGGEPRTWESSGNPVPRIPSSDRRPNILWISAEDISPDLGCYGDTYARTPNLDRLAREGARFSRAFTPAGVCAVVRSGIITGMYPISQASHHMRSRIVPPAGVKCFTEYLRTAGYYCTNNKKTDYQFESPKTAWDRNGIEHGDWRGRAPGQPFFSVINLTVSHESQIRHGEKTHATTLGRLPSELHHAPNLAGPHLPPIYPNTPDSRKDWAWYADNISELDRQVGQILQQLEDDGLRDNTMVVFWGDHGRGLPRGKRWIYDSGVLIPMIVRWPGQEQANTTREDLVSTQDLAPTMLAAAGVDVPDYMQGRVFLGDNQQPEPGFLFFHRDRMDEAYELMRAVRDRRFKYIRNYFPRRPYAQHIQYMDLMPTIGDLRQMHVDGMLNPAQSNFLRANKPAEELYDLKADPHETVNLAWMQKHADRLAVMRHALESWQDKVVDHGLVPEPILMERMRPNDTLETVTPPSVQVVRADGKLTLRATTDTPGATIAFRDAKGKDLPWKIIDDHAEVTAGQTYEVVACRAGFTDSPTKTMIVP